MISVIIPCLNEESRVPYVISFAKQNPNVSEVIVVDDGSIDNTASAAESAGAKVILGSILGKGGAMEDGLLEAHNEIVVYLDGDLSLLEGDLIKSITTPIIENKADFVKANFSRKGGRVTVLTARPLLTIFFPEVAHITQPLGGIIAGKKSMLEKLHFETDYGVDIAILLDMAHIGARITQVDVGHIEHNSHDLETLGDMAKQVSRVILQRAAKYNRLNLGQIRAVQEIERHTQAELSRVVDVLGEVQHLALFDMDGVILDGRFIRSLAEYTNKTSELAQYLDNHSISDEERTCAIAKIFQGVSRDAFERTAKAMSLMQGAAETVLHLRKKGYRVGIVTDSFYIASEIIRKRVFADFSIAHLMRFHDGVATGKISLSSAMQCPKYQHFSESYAIYHQCCQQHTYCKKNAMLRLCHSLEISPEQVIAVGDGKNDICLLQSVGKSVAFCAKTDEVRTAAKHIVDNHDLVDILRTLQIAP